MSGKVAIVGAGPSGCYLAQALLKASPALAVDIVDSMPVPFGLVRYGVAADHQGTKGVARQFERIFERQGARFFGNVHIGRDLTLDALREAYDAVVVATGLSEDRKLCIEGSDLPQVCGAAALTRALHEHPDAGPLPDLGKYPLIVGNGNVAIDLLRVLSKTPAELGGTDLGSGPSAWLARNDFESITILGRSSAASAKFDPVMIRELKKLENVSIDVSDPGHAHDTEGRKRLEALAEIDGHCSGALRVTFRFGLSPLAIEGPDRVSDLRVAGAGGEETIPASSIITAIGFASNGDPDRERLREDCDIEAGKLADGLYSAGWFLHGPRGTIAESRIQAQDLASRILWDIAPRPDRIGCAVFRELPNVVDFAGWRKIDAAELACVPDDRCRRKISSTAELLRVGASRERNR